MFSLQNRTRVQVWLYENINTRIEGHIVGFDEYMNLVLDDAAEVIIIIFWHTDSSLFQTQEKT